MFVSDRSHAEAFDVVFRSVFGGSAEPERAESDELETVAAPPDDRPQADDVSSRAASGDGDRSARAESSPLRAGEERSEGTETGVPLAMASDEEVLARKSFDALEPEELAQLYRLMSRLEVAAPPRRTRRYERGCRGRRIDMRRTLRASLRTGGDPSPSWCVDGDALSRAGW